MLRIRSATKYATVAYCINKGGTEISLLKSLLRFQTGIILERAHYGKELKYKFINIQRYLGEILETTSAYKCHRLIRD